MPLLPGLLDEIAIWEILVRLLPKALIHCRAVCRAWCCTTFMRDFLLVQRPPCPPAHLPPPPFYGGDVESLDIIHYDHRTASDQLQSVAQLGHLRILSLDEASCDGLLVHSVNNNNFGIYNAATRHSSVRSSADWRGWRPGCRVADGEVRGVVGVDEGLQHESVSNMIVVFDTITKSFRQMRAPVVPRRANVFERDGLFGMSDFNDASTIIDIRMVQDYESEVWNFKCRVGLPVGEIDPVTTDARIPSPWSESSDGYPHRLPHLQSSCRWRPRGRRRRWKAARRRGRRLPSSHRTCSSRTATWASSFATSPKAFKPLAPHCHEVRLPPIKSSYRALILLSLCGVLMQQVISLCGRKDTFVAC